jgi:hypothetical protein
VQRAVIECKLLRGSVESTLAEGLPQTADCAQRCGADEAHLVLFDRRPGVSWEQKVWRREERAGARLITVWGA